MQDKEKLSFRTALIWIIGSSLCISGSVYLAYFSYRSHVRKKMTDPRFLIESIVQTGPQKEALPTFYLAEVLGLSCDQPLNIHRLDIKWAEEKLLQSPLIKSVRVEKKIPNTLSIDYEVRRPFAILYDYENIAIDEEGYLFVMRPFFDVPDLVQIVLGLGPFEEAASWQNPLKGNRVHLALKLCHFFSSQEFPFKVKRIDVAKAEEKSFGQREIVICLSEELTYDQKQFVFPKILRLSPKNYESQLGNFLVLRQNMMKDYQKQIEKMEISSSKMEFKPQVIDFRIDQLAYIESE